MRYELVKEQLFETSKDRWLGNLRFDFYDSLEMPSNKFFPSDIIYNLDREGAISLKEIQEEVNTIQFDMIKNFDNVIKLAEGHGYSKEAIFYISMGAANYAIKLTPTIDSYNYIYIYKKDS